MGFFDLFGKKEAAPETKTFEPAKKRKWIGCIDASWVDIPGAHVAFNLFIEPDGKRACVSTGISPESHPLYTTRVFPWLQGADDKLIVNDLVTEDTEYWKPVHEAEKKAPAVKPSVKAATRRK